MYSEEYYLQVDTERKLNVYMAFRRRPRRLLNVLCTFHLHPRSTGLNTFAQSNITEKLL